MADFDELRTLLAPITESELRHRLRETGQSLHPLVAGVNQDSLDALGESLAALSEWYENGNRETQQITRRIVITAKDHAKLAAANRRVPDAKRVLKGEMAAWMLTWLENPAIFPLWLSIRRKTIQ